MPKKKKKKIPLRERLSDHYSDNEKNEIVDLVYLRNRWFNETKLTRSNFEITYNTEHG